jgi:hypothetical protein
MLRPSLLVALLLASTAFAQDTRKTCLIAAEIRAPVTKHLEEVTAVLSNGKSVTATLIGGGITHGAGFFLKDVPEGEFRVTNVRYEAPPRGIGQPPKPPLRFDLLDLPPAPDRGAIANELSGTCKGGFIWLGSYKVDVGALSASMELGDNEVTSGNARGELKTQVKGTAWESEIDKPLKTTPLAKGKSPEVKVDAEANAKAVAAVAAQTRNAAAPPSDEGALEAAAGVWVLTSVNGKPLPYLQPASKCTFHEATMTVKADGTYTAFLLMECAGQKYPFPTAGYIGIKGGVVTQAPTKGPPANPLTKITLKGDELVSTTAGEAYLYKKKQ